MTDQPRTDSIEMKLTSWGTWCRDCDAVSAKPHKMGKALIRAGLIHLMPVDGDGALCEVDEPEDAMADAIDEHWRIRTAPVGDNDD